MNFLKDTEGKLFTFVYVNICILIYLISKCLLASEELLVFRICFRHCYYNVHRLKILSRPLDIQVRDMAMDHKTLRKGLLLKVKGEHWLIM